MSEQTIHLPRPNASDPEVLLETAANALATIVAVIGIDGTILAVNRAWRHATGMAGAENKTLEVGANYLETCDCSTGTHAANAAAIANGIRAVLAGEQDEFYFEYRCDGPGGARWFAARVTRCEGTATRVVVAHDDITVWRQAESRLTEAHDSLRAANESLMLSEWRFRNLAENIPEVFWLFDTRIDQTVYVSPAYETVWGRSTEALYRDRWDFLGAVHPDDRDKLFAVFNEKRSAAVSHVYRIIDAEGAVRWIRARSKPIVDETGQVVRVAGIAEDITDLKLTEERLSQLARIVESCNDAIIGTDMDGIITSWNPAAQRIFGYAPDEIMGQPIAKLAAAENLPGLHAVHQRLGGGEVVERTDTVCVRKDGRQIELSVTVFPVRDAAGNLVGASAIAHDITERRQLERELVDAAARERQRIGRDLHDDICQQLTAVSCMARLVERHLTARGAPEAGEAERIVQMVQQTTQQTRNLARRLYVENLGPGGLPHALQNLASNTESMFDIACEFHWDGPDLVLEASTANHLYRIAQEAVCNAARHANAQTVKISLAASDNDLVLRVEDDGVGIPSPLPARGLGLQIMDQRARMIGADLCVTGTCAMGTCVSCKLPFNKETKGVAIGCGGG